VVAKTSGIAARPAQPKAPRLLYAGLFYLNKKSSLLGQAAMLNFPPLFSVLLDDRTKSLRVVDELPDRQRLSGRPWRNISTASSIKPEILRCA
jgi:hypothetical protein